MMFENKIGNQQIEILIAEDSPTQAEQLSQLLEENGFRVTVATNGKEALAAAHQRKPALIISDIMMPEMDGYMLCKELKSRDNLCGIPVILLTSLSRPSDIIRGLECGADNFIPKPYERDYLLTRIQHILLNVDLRTSQKIETGLQIIFSNQKYFITSQRQQILDLLLSTYETAVHKNLQLNQSQNELRQLNERLEQKVKERTDQLHKVNAELEQRVIQRSAELDGTTSLLNNVLESSTEYSIIAADLKGNILTWNEGARRNYGYTAEEMMGKLKFNVLHTPEDLASRKVDEFVETALKIGKAEGVFDHVCKNGERFPCSVSVTLRRDANDAPIGYLLISKDITEQKALEEELRKKNQELEEQNRLVQKADRLKSEFLANMSHELRTPLNGIIGFAELMHDEKVGPISADHKEYLGDILTSARHLLQLINDVLDLSKVEAGKMEFSPEHTDPAAIVGEVRDIVRSLAAKKRITLKIEADPSLSGIEADRRSLKQILYNYVSNALKFTPEEGMVTVRVKPEDSEYFRLEVQDTGIGIKPEAQGRLFSEFQQLDAAAGKKYPGTGLGLALTKRLVEAQRGRVGVTSTPGTGSVFYAVLPRSFHGGEKVTEETKPVPLFPGAPLILVVEDDVNDRASIAGVLRRAGYAVETVATGAEALVRCREQHFDAITLDIMLPDMSGRAVLEKLRERGLNQETPVIVVTLLAHKGIIAGFQITDIIAKPASEESILKALRRCGVSSSSPGPILIVDDDESSLKLADKMLRQLGYRAICRPNAASALEAASTEQPAAVVLDLIMPEMNGFEFLKHFRETASSRHTPVIVWTGKDLTDSERAELQSEASFIAKKDHNAEELIHELKNVLQAGRLSA
jgi:PAS domain S-box-containing protein